LRTIRRHYSLAGLLLLVLIAGCATTGAGRAERETRGYIYYLDGAGGGGITNWAGGVRQGMRDAGYDGAGEMFTWQTGLGVVADQTVNNRYKRDKARRLVDKIVQYQQQHPGAPVTLMGLSAGTAIAVFTLEELPASTQVDSVILLSGSLSATHDLTKALRHVRDKMYITTSQKDLVLGGLMQLSGTADRGAGTTATIGVQGPQMPPGTSAETRSLYTSKLVVIPWKQEFARYGNSGKHTDTVKAPFVARYIAPLVKTRSQQQFAATPVAAARSAANPDFQRWANFEPGSWVVMEGRQTINGVTKPLRMKVTLMRKSKHQVVFRRTPLEIEGKLFDSPLAQTIYASARIEPQEHPATHPDARIRSLGTETVQIGSRRLRCSVNQISAPGSFADWGDHPEVTVYSSREVPCGIVKVDIKTQVDNQTVEVHGKVVDFYAAGKRGEAD
jgi:pimeloyl-ACP methyl ester carboxylesterase